MFSEKYWCQEKYFYIFWKHTLYVITKFRDSSFSQSDVKVKGSSFTPLPHTQKRSQKSPPRIRLKVVLKSFRSWSLVARNLSFCTYKSSHRRCSVRKGVLRNSQENTCARVSFLIKRLWHRFFPVNFVKFLWTPFLTEHLRTTASAHTKLITIAAMKIIITSNEWVEFLTIE